MDDMTMARTFKGRRVTQSCSWDTVDFLEVSMGLRHIQDVEGKCRHYSTNGKTGCGDGLGLRSIGGVMVED